MRVPRRFRLRGGRTRAAGTRPATKPAGRPTSRDRGPARPTPARRSTPPPARAATARTTRPAPRPKRRGPAGRLTARAAVLGLVVCALALSLAYPLKQYLAQRGDIAALREQNAAAQRQVKQLEQRRNQLKDPAYIRAQARERLQFVLPGETPFVVLRTGEPPPAPGSAAAKERAARTNPWYGALWSSVRAADRAP